MPGLKFLIVIFIAITGCNTLMNNIDLEKELNKVPDEERESFLKYHLKLGYELSNLNKSRLDLEDATTRLSIGLYEKYKREHLVMNYGRLRIARKNIVCFPNGECIDIDDPGVHPF